MHDFEEILLKWKPISKADAKGEVLGYRIQYWLSELHEVPVPQSKIQFVDILEPVRTATIKGLQAYAQYRIRILAFTEGGFGVWSKLHNGGKSINMGCCCVESTLYRAKRNMTLYHFVTV